MAAQLNHLPGDESDDDLGRLDQDVDQRAERAVGLDEFLEFLRIAEEADDGRPELDRDQGDRAEERREQNDMEDEMGFGFVLIRHDFVGSDFGNHPELYHFDAGGIFSTSPRQRLARREFGAPNSVPVI